ncbi:MAG: hypothetical protein EXS76_02570 [Nitrosarchaeum sp.]|nr:hypothetical protein [Nitrosarchaeum sp.]
MSSENELREALQKEYEKGHFEHDRPTNISAYAEATLPDYVWKFVTLEEVMTGCGLFPFELSRLKKDEMWNDPKNPFKALNYFDMRISRIREVLKDQKIMTDDQFRSEVDKLKKQYKEQGKTPQGLELEALAMINYITVTSGILGTQPFTGHYQQVRARTPITGAKIVAKAWVDPDFKALLKVSPKEAIYGWNPSVLHVKDFDIIDPNGLEVPENTEKVRNVVVCTVCSCYPREFLGEPPLWYVSETYKKRIIHEPRAILKDWGLNLADDVEIRVYDINADIHYMVLPMRPKGTEGWSEEELSKLVTRDSLLGVADPLTPAELKAQEQRS